MSLVLSFTTCISLIFRVSFTQLPISFICIDSESGLVFTESNADIPRPPASMIKMMLMLLVAEGIEEGKWSVDTPVVVSEHAASIGGSQVYLKPGEIFPLDHMMRAIAVASANDAAMAVAEALWGSEKNYLEIANRKANELGLSQTKIQSVHGLPPDPGKESDITTAREMAILARHCLRKPIILNWCKQLELQFRPEENVRYNTNKLLWHMPGCDGLKTGYTKAAGFCITATAVRNDVRLIVVVMGEQHLQQRFQSAQTILEDVFKKVTKIQYFAKHQPIGVNLPVVNSPLDKAPIISAQDIFVVVPTKDKDRVTTTFEIPSVLRAPISSGQTVGFAKIELDGYMLARAELTISQELKPGGWRWRLAKTAMVP